MLSRGVRRLVCAIVVAACGDREHAEPRPKQPSKLESAITRDLSAKLGEPPVVHCVTLFGYPRGCTATLADRSTLAIRVHDAPKRWTWEVAGLLVDARPIEAYVGGVLEDLGAAQGVSCGTRMRGLAPGGRVECGLARGGKAFVTIGAEGAMSLELALDPGAARARSEAATDLERASRALEHTEDEDEDEGGAGSGARPDGGVRSAP